MAKTEIRLTFKFSARAARLLLPVWWAQVAFNIRPEKLWLFDEVVRVTAE